MAAEEVGKALGGALVGHLLHLDAGPAGEVFRHQIAVAADAGGRVGQRDRWRGPAARDERVERLYRAAGADHEGDRRAGEIGNIGKIVERVIADLRVGHRRKGEERQGGDDSEIVAVGLRMGDELHPDGAAGAGTGFDVELLAEGAGGADPPRAAPASAAPPGANVLTMRTGRLGQSCADTAVPMSATRVAAMTKVFT